MRTKGESRKVKAESEKPVREPMTKTDLSNLITAIGKVNTGSRVVFPITHIKIHFEDQGQDLLWWVVDLLTGAIVDCGPFHKHIYVGKYVFAPFCLKKGELVAWSATPISRLHQPLKTIKYPIVKIQQL